MIDIDIVLLVLKVGILILLYVFIRRVVKAAVRNVRSAAAPSSAAPDIVLPAPLPTFAPDRREPPREYSPAAPMEGSDPSSRLDPRLVVVQSSAVPVGAAFPLSGQMTVGRASGSDIVLNESVVSSAHARLVPRGTFYYVEDLGSTNGTFVDDGQVTEAKLKHESRLRIGDTVFRYEE